MIPVLRATPDVTLKPAPGGFRILAALDAATKILGRDLTLTAGTNDHSTGRHPLGEAYDVRTRDLTTQDILRLVDYLQRILGERFYVVYEVPNRPPDPALATIATINPDASGPHVHVQVRRGTEYPPVDAEPGQRA